MKLTATHTGAKKAAIAVKEFDKEVENAIIVNYWAGPAKKLVKIIHGISTQFNQSEDFSPIAGFEWGIFGFDYEEGLKFRIKPNLESVKAFNEYIRNTHKEKGVPIIFNSGASMIQINTSNVHGETKLKIKDFLQKSGFISPKYDFVFDLI